MSGAFVAGNDAGHAYNDWPWMAGKLVPEEIWDGSVRTTHCSTISGARVLAMLSVASVYRHQW